MRASLGEMNPGISDVEREGPCGRARLVRIGDGDGGRWEFAWSFSDAGLVTHGIGVGGGVRGCDCESSLSSNSISRGSDPPFVDRSVTDRSYDA